MSNEQIRFDDIVRTERYFTATLLPAILLHNSFAGLREFLGRVEKKAPQARDGAGNLIGTKPLPHDWAPDTVELITEFHIARDLKAAGKLAVGKGISVESLDPDRPARRDAPDVVIVVGDQAVVCEGKFFGDCSLDALNKQLRSQRVQVQLLFKARPDLAAYRHVAILPFTFAPDTPDCDAVFTWGRSPIWPRPCSRPPTTSAAGSASPPSATRM